MKQKLETEIQLFFHRIYSYLIFGPFGRLGGCQEMARKDSLTDTIDRGARPPGLEGKVVTGVGRLSVHPPT